MKLKFLAALALSAVMLLSGCAAPAQNETTPESSSAAPETTAVSECVITDSYGSKTELPDDPCVVSLYGSFAKWWLLSGGKRAGITEDAVDEHGIEIDDDTALVSHGRYPYLGFSRTLSNKDRTVIQNALKTADVAAFADRRLPMLSGGERQRVFLAMLLAQNTDVVLFDEPTTYLDAHHKFELMALLSTLKAQNKAVGIVLHELPLAFKFCDRLLLMKNGQIMQSGTPEELLKTGLIEHLFGVSLTPVMLDKEVEYIERKIHS